MFGVFAIGVKKVDGEFLFGEHLVEWGARLQKYNRTATVSARFHLKTTTALGYLAWQLFKNRKRYCEWIYMGYKSDLAGKQLRRLKRYLEENPYFSRVRSLSSAESILHYIDDEGHEFLVEPAGILAFKRGQHPDGIICDDILKDPENRLNLGQIEKINRIFLEEVESMPKEELHLFGTPQDDRDIFHILGQSGAYDYRVYPAIKDWDNRVTLWPEKWDWDSLMEKRQILGERAFNKEFLCRPVRGEESYLKARDYDSLVDESLVNYRLDDWVEIDDYCYCGWDLGKKRHPAHFVVFKYDRDREGLVQVHSKWFDGVDYKDQIDYIRMAIEKFGIVGGRFDNTRGELEIEMEKGELPLELEPMVLSGKAKWEVAGLVNNFVERRKVWFLRDDRQRESILSVDNDLNAPETEFGHGDAFWSVGLALKAFEVENREFVYVY